MLFGEYSKSTSTTKHGRKDRLSGVPVVQRPTANVFDLPIAGQPHSTR